MSVCPSLCQCAPSLKIHDGQRNSPGKPWLSQKLVVPNQQSLHWLLTAFLCSHAQKICITKPNFHLQTGANPSSIHSFATEITCEAMAGGPLSGHQPTVYSEAERSRPKCTATRLRGRLLYTLPPARHTALLSYLPTIRTPFPGHSASSLLAHNF